MNGRTAPEVVAPDEMLARFVVFSSWIRQDGTVRPDAFIPYPHPELSVTRHWNFSPERLWETGREIARGRPATLYGRADLGGIEVGRQRLQVIAKPVPGNPNHAVITGWPLDKPAQKSFAQELAAVAIFHAAPDSK